MLRRFVIPVLVATGVLITPELGLPVADDQTIKEMVQPAIAAGVEFLRQSQTSAGTWLYQGNTSPTNEQVVGASALCGIAMLENRVPSNDKQILAVANVVRRAANDPNFNYNYSVCLSLLFLDRLNRERAVKDEKNFTYKHPDSGLVLGLARKILAGQVIPDGRWGYHLTAANGTNADNSNTQFAVVALWVARKYGKPGGAIDQALSRCEKRLRSSQDGSGAWNYETSTAGIVMRPTGSMTCAGILSLALHAGARVSYQATFADRAGGTGDITRTLNEDQAIVKARAYLVQSLQNNTSPQGGMEGHVTYFLWSLERVATLFKWRKMDGVDWFDIGAKFLMSKQNRNGSWSMDFLSGNYVDTAFALLFLGKSNLLGDLQEAVFDGNKQPLGGGVIPQKKPEVVKNSAEKAKDILAKLLTASPDKQAEFIQELSETKGNDYTEALVEAIQKMQTPTGKELAREGLALRLQRFTANVLNQYMSDNDRELRLAAVTAAKFKPDFRNTPANCSTIIPLLGDQDIGVSTAALETLKSISGQDFGKSVDRWSRWLEQSKTKKP